MLIVKKESNEGLEYQMGTISFLKSATLILAFEKLEKINPLF